MGLAVEVNEYSDIDNVSNLLPVVIVGSGPVGVRVAQELIKLNPDKTIVLYGDEPWEPYNRVRLTQMLAGHATWADIFKSLNVPDVPNLIKRYNCPVVDIDTNRKIVTDASGDLIEYSKLVLATGSKPYVPTIDGMDLEGIYTFRNMSDVHQLMARRVRSRKTLVMGGGLLGLEAAKALQRSNTEVTIIQHGARLMGKQLDDKAAALIRLHVETLGIRVVVMDAVKRMLGSGKVEGVLLHSGVEMAFDTVVLATGITPNVELAKRAGLQVGRGIRVDDTMKTSVDDIYAVGECVEHRGKVYGLVAPGFEQASIAAYSINNRKAEYKGSIAASRLKVVGQPVLSIGQVIDEEISSSYRKLVFANEGKGIYRKLIVHRGRLLGAISVGEWNQVSQLQERVTFRKRVWPWELVRFKRTGDLWSHEVTEDVFQWPSNTTICNCTGVTKGVICDAINQGCNNVEAISQCTGASTVCGSCKPKLMQFLGKSDVEIVKDKNNIPLVIISLVSIVLVLITLLGPTIAYPDSVQVGWHVSELWLDSFAKQVSGFTLLGLSFVVLLVSLRKRIHKFTYGEFTHWRIFHVLLGLMTVVTLFLHTGFSFGEQFNFLLMFCFVSIVAVGAGLGILTSRGHVKPSLSIEKWKRYFVWSHIVFFWPLPALVGFHIVASYYY